MTRDLFMLRKGASARSVRDLRFKRWHGVLFIYELKIGRDIF
jgi:hypothetical protein